MELLNLAGKFFKTRGDKLPVICIFGRRDLELVTSAGEVAEEKRLDCRCYDSDDNLERVLDQDRPHVLITIGEWPSYPNLLNTLRLPYPGSAGGSPCRTDRRFLKDNVARL